MHNFDTTCFYAHICHFNILLMICFSLVVPLRYSLSFVINYLFQMQYFKYMDSYQDVWIATTLSIWKNLSK